jgi:hypothetical protein
MPSLPATSSQSIDVRARMKNRSAIVLPQERTLEIQIAIKAP